MSTKEKEFDKLETEFETEVRDKIKQALAEGKIPMECIEYMEMGDYEAKVVIFKEV